MIFNLYQRICLSFVCTILIVATLNAQEFSWQGHRGCRGLLPENTIPAFLKALEFPEINTLEMDVVITADQKILVSHEAWMNHEICSYPDGSPVEKEQEKVHNLYKMPLSEIQKFDCGSRGHKRFLGQQAMATTKPQLCEVVTALRKSGYNFPVLNIEIKTEGRRFDRVFHPEPAEFVSIVLNEFKQLKIEHLVTLQSFDVRILREIKKTGSRIPLSLLVENPRGFKWNIKRLGFMPDNYSCHYTLVSWRLIKKCHELGVNVIPWTVNDLDRMKKLVSMGVDGIITDYPNLAFSVKN